MVRKFTLVAAFFGLTALASADVLVAIPDRATQNPTDIIDWGQLGPSFTGVPGPAAITTFNGITGSVNDAGNFMERLDEGNGWTGNFDFGETLLWTNGPNVPFAGNGPITLMLTSGVNSFGFEIQRDLYGAFTASVDALDSMGNVLGSLTLPGTSDGSENGSALFLGLEDLSGGNIFGFRVTTDTNDFAIDDVSFTTSVPEPGFTWAIGAVLAGFAGFRRWQRS